MALPNFSAIPTTAAPPLTAPGAPSTSLFGGLFGDPRAAAAAYTPAPYDALAPLFEQGRNVATGYTGQAIGGLSPYQGAGGQALRMEQKLLGLGPGGPANILPLLMQQPEVQAMLQLGSQNVLRNQAATGALGSGYTDVALQNLGQQTAQQAYEGLMTRLAGVAGGGQQAATQAGNWGTGLGGQLLNSYGTQGGAAYSNLASIQQAQAAAANAGDPFIKMLTAAIPGIAGLGVAGPAGGGSGGTLGGNLFSGLFSKSA